MEHVINTAPRIMTSDVGSFAQHTVMVRMPAIIDRVLAKNAYPEQIREELEALRLELTQGAPVGRVAEIAPDRDEWDAAWLEWAGHTWHDIPWYFAEAYFYRRILEAVRYFQPGPWQGVDPFKPQKEEELVGENGALTGFERALERLPSEPEECLSRLLLFNLWGNRADLTFADMARTAYAGLEEDATAGLLIDHRRMIGDTLARGIDRVDFVNDNGGLELLFDLALVDHLLGRGLARQVRFHLKSQPFFVSDACPWDVRHALGQVNGRPGLQELGGRLQGYLDGGQWMLLAEPFWVMPYGYYRMPDDLWADLRRSNLIFFKGDANYRRLLDDRRWPHSASLAALTAYIPASYATIRTIKAELMVDLTDEQYQTLQAADPGWMVNGQYGLIQYVGKGDPERSEGSPESPAGS